MTFAFNAYSSLLLPGAVTGAAATLGLLARGLRRRAAPDLLLALLLLLPTLTTMARLLQYAGWGEQPGWPSVLLRYVPWHASLGLGPAYYLYFRSLTNQEFAWRRAWPHLLPLAGQLLLAASVTAYDLLWQPGWQLASPSPTAYGPAGSLLIAGLDYRVPQVLTYLLLLYYAWRVRTEYRRYRCYLDDNFSNQEKLRFEGLRQLLGLQVLGLGISLVFTALDLSIDLSQNIEFLAYFLRGMLIYALAAVGLQANYAATTSPLAFEPALPPPPGVARPNVLLEAPAGATSALTPQPVLPLLSTESTTAVASPLPELASPLAIAAQAPAPPLFVEAETALLPPAELAPEVRPWRDKLLHLMAEQAPWREPDLSLTELAQRLKLHPAQLSKVLNAGCGLHFNDFVNGYRVQEALRLLADPGRAHYSLVGIALESGFNSKSTFNRVFKSKLGYPPSAVARPKL